MNQSKNRFIRATWMGKDHKDTWINLELILLLQKWVCFMILSNNG